MKDGSIVAGSDHGIVLLSDDSIFPAPFPQGSRKEARDVLSLAWHQETLHIATSRGQYTWELEGPVTGRGLPKDGVGGFDDLRCIYSAGDRLLKGWRTHLEGGQGPPEALCFARDDQDRVYVGTSSGLLTELNGSELEQYRRDGHASPVRHLAWCQNALWIAAAGALHKRTPAGQDSRPREPLALCSDHLNRLWSIEGNQLAVGQGDWPTPIPVSLERPWCLAASQDALWVGARGGIYRFYFSELGSHT